MTLDELPGWAHELVSSAQVARMAFADEHDHPRALPVTFAVVGGVVWSAVDQKPKRADGKEIARLRFLRRSPRAALCIDRYDDDWSRLAWVQLLCAVEIVAVDDAPGALDALTGKYEPYRAQPPPGPLLRFEVERALHWRASG